MSEPDAKVVGTPHELYTLFNPKTETEKFEGAFLPHWAQGATIAFVTFRLADSLPQEKLKAVSREKDDWLKNHPEPRDEAQQIEFYRLFSARLQRWLDAGYGSMALAKPSLRQMVENALKHFDGVRYHLDEFVVAANHVHVLMAPKAGFSLAAILHSWKVSPRTRFRNSFEQRVVSQALPFGNRNPGTIWCDRKQVWKNSGDISASIESNL